MSTITITVDGVDMTDHVIFSTASFESQLGAVAGSFEFAVLDLNRTLSFSTGSEVILTIDGEVYFGGFTTQVTRKSGLPVDQTQDLSRYHSREWILRGVDYNILFDKRVVYNVASPNSDFVIDPTSGSWTDQYAINLLTSTYLDLAADGIDLTTYVQVVNDPTPDAGATFDFGPPGITWRKQMEIIASITGALWYISPTKALHYQSVEDTVAPFSFSDQPNNTTSFGFREFSYIDDATNVVNDALVWGGSAFGSTGVSVQTVFGRATDTTAISVVGRWQKPETHFGEDGFFTTTDVTRRANLIVYGDVNVLGNPTGGEIGLRYAQKTAKLSWFSPRVAAPLVPGSLVTIAINTYGFTVALPLRSVRISFPTPTVARFDAFLGFQTTDPWALWKFMRTYSDKINTILSTPALPAGTSDGSTASTSGTSVCMTPSPAPDGSTTTFTLTDTYQADSLQVWMNGLLQRPGIEYTESSPLGKQFTFYTAPLAGDQLWVCYVSA